VILRVIRGRGDQARAAALRAELIERLGPGPIPTDGPDRYHLGAREGAAGLEVLALACWPSAEAAAAGDAREISPLRIAARHLDQVQVAHFEIDVNVLRDADVHPAVLRVATGRFSSPGADIQMQELLRERVPTIGDEMTEAYIGRRILERDVDVAFVSAWRGLPSEGRLEDPFWPDISLRYDTFDVEVYSRVE
jgi:hypothetical protein